MSLSHTRHEEHTQRRTGFLYLRCQIEQSGSPQVTASVFPGSTLRGPRQTPPSVVPAMHRRLVGRERWSPQRVTICHDRNQIHTHYYYMLGWWQAKTLHHSHLGLASLVRFPSPDGEGRLRRIA